MCLTWYRCGLVKGIKWDEIDIELLPQVSTDELPHVSAKAVYSAMGTPLVVGDADGTGPDVLAFPITGFTKHSVGGNVVTSFGGDKPHENTPLSIAAYGWKRTG